MQTTGIPSNGNISCVTGPLCWEFTGHRWIPLKTASNAELWCFVLASVTAMIAGGLSALLILLVNSGNLFLSESALVYQHRSLLFDMLPYFIGSLVFTRLSVLITGLFVIFTWLYVVFTWQCVLFTRFHMVCAVPAAVLVSTLFTL